MAPSQETTFAATAVSNTMNQREMSVDSDSTMIDGCTLIISPHHQTSSLEEMDCSAIFPSLLHPFWLPNKETLPKERLHKQPSTKPIRRNAVNLDLPIVGGINKNKLTLRLRRQKCHTTLSKLTIPELQLLDNLPQNGSSKAVGLEL
jgi:hypothetical protein